MRKDYAYVDEASVICIACTAKGNKYLKELTDEHGLDTVVLEIAKANPLVDLLLVAEDTYIPIYGTSVIDIDSMYDAIIRTYVDEFESPDDAPSRDILISAITEGYIGIQKVIWDETV